MFSVLEYLAEHPNAMDSMEGMAESWVMRNAVQWSSTNEEVTLWIDCVE